MKGSDIFKSIVLPGALAGLIGGLVSGAAMVQLGFLPIVASLIGSTSPLTGSIVHLVISDLIGISYSLLFQRQSYDIGSALGWGVSYGFFWWILGPLTLMPILLGAPPQWTIEAAAGALGSLIGHLIYGAGLGITFYLYEFGRRCSLGGGYPRSSPSYCGSGANRFESNSLQAPHFAA